MNLIFWGIACLVLGILNLAIAEGTDLSFFVGIFCIIVGIFDVVVYALITSQ